MKVVVLRLTAVDRSVKDFLLPSKFCSESAIDADIHV